MKFAFDELKTILEMRLSAHPCWPVMSIWVKKEIQLITWFIFAKKKLEGASSVYDLLWIWQDFHVYEYEWKIVANNFR